jgi:hypothetical protein
MLKVLDRSGDGMRTALETASDTEKGYKGFKEAGANTLDTRFLPDAVDAKSGAATPIAVQEALGPKRIQISKLVTAGQVPRRIFQKWYEQIRLLNNVRSANAPLGYVVEDLNTNNWYVEMTQGTVGQLAKAIRNGMDCAGCDFIVGCLDTDRVFNYADYLRGKLPASQDAVLSWLEYTSGGIVNDKGVVVMRPRTASLAAILNNERNTIFREAIPQDAVAYRAWRAKNPGPLWPAGYGLDYMQEKFLEAKLHLKFDRSLNPNSLGVPSGGFAPGSALGQTTIPLEWVLEYFPQANHSTRFNDFTLRQRAVRATGGPTGGSLRLPPLEFPGRPARVVPVRDQLSGSLRRRSVRPQLRRAA